VGSYFKKDGKADNLVDEKRVKAFTEALAKQRRGKRSPYQ
jgi:predicted TIM-barrel enzyme